MCIRDRIMVASMFIICLLADRYIRIAFREQFARKTLVIEMCIRDRA